MKIVRYLLFLLVGLGAIATIFSFLGPKTSALSRTVNIDAPRDAVFPYIKSLKENDRWSPWSTSDPTNKNVWEGEDGTVGSKNSWVGEKTGVGSQIITKIVANEEVGYQLDFKEPFESQANANVKLADGADGTTDVTWGFSCENDFVTRIIFFFSPLEDALAPEYEKGLGLLKALVESELPKMEVEAMVTEPAAVEE